MVAVTFGLPGYRLMWDTGVLAAQRRTWRVCERA
jgi:hypothetical protein